MNREEQFDQVYMQIAYSLARLSRAKRRKTAALIVRDRNILSYGYNGMPSGMTNACENMLFETKSEVLHAEANAITKCAQEGLSTFSATMYCTFSPCMDCAKLILQAGITRLVYSETFSDTSGLELLALANIEVVEL